MKSSLKVYLFAAGALFIACSNGWSQVSTPEERIATLEKADRFVVVTPEDVDGHYSDAINPFAPNEPEAVTTETVVEAAPVAEVKNLPDEGIVLQAIADQLTPSGVMQIGSRVILLFGERRVASGDFIPVQYQNREYQVQVMSASSRSFTLRLNREVITKRIQ